MIDLDNQIKTMQDLAKQHYGDDEAGRNAYMVELLMARLREYHARFVRSVPHGQS